MFTLKVMQIAGALAVCASGYLASGNNASPFHYMGMYVEGCSCGAPCPCELTGVAMGCEGVGFFQAKAGSNLGGKDFGGAKMAYATKPGDYVVIYVDAPTAAKRKAMEAFARKALGPFGKIEAVKTAKISIAGKAGNYKASVNGGKVMSFSSTVMKGGDNKGPMVYSNIHDPVHPTVMQAKTTVCTYTDGKHHFELKDSNAFFNPTIHSTGKF